MARSERSDPLRAASIVVLELGIARTDVWSHGACMETFDWESWVASRDVTDGFLAPPPHDAPERARMAWESVVVLDMVKEVLIASPDLTLSQTLRKARAGRTEHDRAGVYLKYAIRENFGLWVKLAEFSNVIGNPLSAVRTARLNAQLVVDGYLEASAAGD